MTSRDHPNYCIVEIPQNTEKCPGDLRRLYHHHHVVLVARISLTLFRQKKLDGNYTRMLRAILNKSWRQHPTRYQLYGRLPPITKTIQARRTRHAGHCWRSRDELISDVLLWTPTHGRAKAGRPARTYIQQLYEDTGCSPEDLPEAMNDRENEETYSHSNISEMATSKRWCEKLSRNK